MIGWHIGNQDTISPAIVKAIYDADVLVTETGIDKVMNAWWNNHCDSPEYGTGWQPDYMQDNKHKLVDYYEIEENNAFDEILEKYSNIGVMAFEGMPGVQDPAQSIMSKALDRGDYIITVTPGPDAIASVLAVSPSPSSEFAFLGIVSDVDSILNSISKYYIDHESKLVGFIRDIDLKNIELATKTLFGNSGKITIGVNLTRNDEFIITGNISTAIDNVKFVEEPEVDRELNKVAFVIWDLIVQNPNADL